MKILIQQTYMNNIGGIETAMYQFARKFHDKAELCFVINAKADGADAQLDRLRPYGNVIFDPSREQLYGADIALVFTPIMQSVPWDNIVASKIYQVIHSDIAALKELPQWRDFNWKPNSKIDKILSVSETAQRGLKNALGLDSEILPNIFELVDTRRVFAFMSRATSEKGFDKVLDLIDRFDRAGKDYLLIVSSLIDPYGPYWRRMANNKRIVYAGASMYNDSLLRGCDYLLQLSQCESYCYSVREALARGVAVIGTKIPEITNVVKDGENGYLLESDLSNLDIDKIFDYVPKPKGYSEKLSPKWAKLLEGKL